MYIKPTSAISLTDGYAPKVRRRSSSAKVSIMLDRMEKPTARSKCRSIYMRVSLRNSESSHLFHSCAIKIFGSSKDSSQYMMRPDSRMWVHCHCPYFFYYCEEALVRVKASSYYGVNERGEKCDPSKNRRIKNPKMIPYLCKHLYAAMLALLRMEAKKTGYKPFINKKSPYKGDYKNKMPSSYRK